MDALRSEINNFSRLEEIPVKFESEIDSVNPPTDIAVSLLLTISDDGRGFTPDIVKKLPGLGLKSMRERMRLVGGSISYISRQGQGTTVQARVDIPSN